MLPDLLLQSDTAAYEHALRAIIAAVVYSGIWYARAYLANGEAFDPYKFGATVAVGMGVGLALAYSGVTVDAESFAHEFAIYVGAISIVEALLKSVFPASRYAQNAPAASSVGAIYTKTSKPGPHSGRNR